VGTEAELRAAIIASNSNDDTTNEIDLTAIITLTIANSAGQENASAEGDLDFDNLNSTVASKLYHVNGAGFTIDANGIDPVAQILGSDVTVKFANITLTGGVATDSGIGGAAAGSEDAHGGGILNEGGSVSFTSAIVQSNTAAGSAGANGLDGTGTTETGAGLRGGDGANGKNASGGGLYSNGGLITISHSTFSDNNALGGDGGDVNFDGHDDVITGSGPACGHGSRHSPALMDLSSAPTELGQSAIRVDPRWRLRCER